MEIVLSVFEENTVRVNVKKKCIPHEIKLGTDKPNRLLL